MSPEASYSRIVTHDDFDGIVSAALVSFATGIDDFHFTGPVSIQAGRTRTTDSDIVCDLPCPVRAGMWFDHHPGNLEDLQLRGIDPSAVPGRFSLAPSCARVIFDYYSAEVEFPSHLTDTLIGADRVDSFDYRTMEEWRAPSPERKLSDSIIAAASTGSGKFGYMTRMARLLRDGSMQGALTDPEVSTAIQAYSRLEEHSLKLVDQDARFHPDDTGHEVVIIDLTRHNRRPDIIRTAAFMRYPQALAVLLVGNQFVGGRKTTDLTLSMSLSFLMNDREHRKDIGEIMRRLNIGDGHPGAAGGRIDCASKNEMIKVRDRVLAEIIGIWKSQQGPPITDPA